jgi:hypothetical protein
MRSLHNFILSVVSFLFMTSFGLKAATQAQPLVQGNIKVLSSVGEVTSASGSLRVNDFIKEGAGVKTSSNSRAVLLFDNGTIVEVGSGTDIWLEQYVVAPFSSGQVDYKVLTSEPTASRTKLVVTRGSIICKVPKLSKNSSYLIDTPLGSGQVKGTVVHVNVSENLDTFVVTEGAVLVQRGSESFYVHGAETQQGDQEVQANTENSVAISNDPNQILPEGLLSQMATDANSFSSLASQLVTSNAMQGSPQQSPSLETTDSSTQTGEGQDSNVSGPDGGSLPPALPAPFGGGGGGSGGGGIYSN